MHPPSTWHEPCHWWKIGSKHLSFVFSAEHPQEQGLLSIRMCLLQKEGP